jgi:hypothetical protein
MSIAYFVCVCVALGVQHAMRTAILPSVVCPAVPYFSTLSQKQARFTRKKLLNIKCVFWFSLPLLPETYPIIPKIL